MNQNWKTIVERRIERAEKAELAGDDFKRDLNKTLAEGYLRTLEVNSEEMQRYSSRLDALGGTQ